MDTLRNVRLELPDGSYSDKIPLYISADLVDLLNNKTLKEYIKENNNDIYNLQTINNNNTIALATLSKAEIHAAASTSAMTNIDYIYVNISDGYWYSYYNNTWTKSGLFQATYEHDFKEDYNRMANTMEDGLVTGTRIDTNDSAYWKADLELGGNTYQEEIVEVVGIEVSGTDITINDYDSTKEGKFTKFGGNTFQQSYTGKNLFSGFTKGKRLDFTTGAEVNNNNSAISDYIPVNFSTNPNYFLSGLTDTLHSLVYSYNSNKEGLKRTSGNPYLTFDLNTQAFISGTPQGTGDIAYIRVCQYKLSDDTGTIDDIDNLQTQLEVGNSATSYEPYVGGKASPNPDYPQDIKVVTGTNSVKIQNKNLLDRTTCVENKALTWVAGELTNKDEAVTSDYIKIKEIRYATNYYATAMFYDKSKTYIGCMHSDGTVSKTTGNSTKAFIVPSGLGIYYVRVAYRPDYNNNEDMTQVDIELEAKESGSVTNNDYIPHQEQNFTLSLGNIELCKIETYQDYIYHSLVDGNWYKHAEIGKKQILKTDNLAYNTANEVFYDTDFANLYNDSTIPVSNYFTGAESTINNSGAHNQGDGKICFRRDMTDRLYLNKYDTTTLQDFKDWLDTVNVYVYYVLVTPTDTEITDTTLINQLNAVEEASGYEGTTYITTTNSGTDLAVIPSYKYNFITPAPSPAKSSDIKVVTGTNTVKVSNKNFLNISNFTPSNSNNVQVITTHDKLKLIAKSTTGAQYGINFIYNLDPTKKYTLSWKGKKIMKGTAGNPRLMIRIYGYTGSSYTELRTWYQSDPIIGQEYTGNITVTGYSTYRIFAYNNSSASVTIGETVDYYNMQMEENNIQTSYIPHQEQNYTLNLGNIELCKIGDYQDIIFKNEIGNPYYDSTLVDGGYYKRENIRKVVFNGTETWGVQGTYHVFYITNITNYLRVNQNICFCNYYKSAVNSGYSPMIDKTITFRYSSSDTNKAMYIKNNDMSTVTLFKNWLSTHNTIVYYILETPTSIQITDTTLISQLNELYNKIKTYQGISHIYQSNAKMSFIITTDYKKSNLLRIQKLENN